MRLSSKEGTHAALPSRRRRSDRSVIRPALPGADEPLRSFRGQLVGERRHGQPGNARGSACLHLGHAASHERRQHGPPLQVLDCGRLHASVSRVSRGHGGHRRRRRLRRLGGRSSRQDLGDRQRAGQRGPGRRDADSVRGHVPDVPRVHLAAGSDRAFRCRRTHGRRGGRQSRRRRHLVEPGAGRLQVAVWGLDAGGRLELPLLRAAVSPGRAGVHGDLRRSVLPLGEAYRRRPLRRRRDLVHGVRHRVLARLAQRRVRCSVDAQGLPGTGDVGCRPLVLVPRPLGRLVRRGVAADVPARCFEEPDRARNGLLRPRRGIPQRGRSAHARPGDHGSAGHRLRRFRGRRHRRMDLEGRGLACRRWGAAQHGRRPLVGPVRRPAASVRGLPSRSGRTHSLGSRSGQLGGRLFPIPRDVRQPGAGGVTWPISGRTARSGCIPSRTARSPPCPMSLPTPGRSIGLVSSAPATRRTCAFLSTAWPASNGRIRTPASPRDSLRSNPATRTALSTTSWSARSARPGTVWGCTDGRSPSHGARLLASSRILRCTSRASRCAGLRDRAPGCRRGSAASWPGRSPPCCG